ncbi:DUF1289 domain-containing protein [Polaromonas sp.]|uniref:DUF1289 domain-containing protein n=1 Tax=Polaromonas sp. TaxID=1869339 RepID=UPI00334D72FE
MRADTVGADSEVPSPCISVCRMSTVTDMCMGCFRTRNEIAGWSSAGNDGKRAVWSLIRQRMAALQS